MNVYSTGSAATSAVQQHSTRREFFQWVNKWFHTNMAEATHVKPDVPLIATLLQSVGFQLREFDVREVTQIPNSEAKNDSVQVVIQCGTSGLRACLELDSVPCTCPNPEDAKDASLWSVSGAGPGSPTKIDTANKIEESGSNMLPPVSKDTSKMVKDIVHKIFNIIEDQSGCDANKNSKNRSNLNVSRVDTFVRSHTESEIVLTNTTNEKKFECTDRPFGKLQFSKKTSYGWGETVDLTATVDIDEPRSAPPKIKISSPNFASDDFCSSLDSISLKSEEGDSNIATYVIRAHRSLEKAMELIAARKSPTNEKSTATRRSVGSTSSRLSTIPRSTPTTSANTSHTKNPEANAVNTSKNIGLRRKSFHSLGPLKLAAVNAKNSAVPVQSISKAPKTSNNEREASASQSFIPKFSQSLNQSVTIPACKVGSSKAQIKETTGTSRKSLGNPRFGYGNKNT